MAPELFHFLAMGPAPQSGEDATRSLVMSVGYMVVIFVIFYLILIRPQQKQQKELRTMLAALKTGDRVVTTGGIFGVVSQIKEKSVVIKIAENTKVEMLRSGVQQVLPNESKETKEKPK
ncbi:MAG: preprotein translocase subunit YajC [Verrucomicrobia bacterium]|nr:preprotein translocase subunit YajC [Verrucomicrobiota bacterium]